MASEYESNLQRVDQILYEEQPAELLHAGVGVQQDFVSVFTNLVLRQSNLNLQVSPGNKGKQTSVSQTFKYNSAFTKLVSLT